MMAEKPIRIFVEAHTYDQIFEGVRTYISGVYRSLLKLYPKDVECYFAAKNVDVLMADFGQYPNAKFLSYSNNSKAYRFLYEIPKLTKQIQADYVHLQYVVPLFHSGKSIVTIHDLLFNDFPKEFPLSYKISRNLFFSLSAYRADILTTISKYSSSQLQYYYKLPDSKIHMIGNGIDEKWFETFNKPDAAKWVQNHFGFSNYILLTSRVEPRKNHVKLLQSYLELALWKQGIHLVLVGKKSIPVPEFEALWNAIPNEAAVFIHHLQQITQNELTQVYRGARFFVYPSKAEGFGLPPLEAVCSELPIICSNQTALSDFDFMGSYFFNPEVDSLTQKLQWLIHNEAQALEDVVRMKKLVIDSYSFNLVATKLMAILKQNLS
jgi:glycosyltransferase involved in cell wall biosynthesis